MIIILQDGYPFFDSAKFNTCQTEQEAQDECNRLLDLQQKNNELVDAHKAAGVYKRGDCFIFMKHNHTYTYKLYFQV